MWWTLRRLTHKYIFSTMYDVHFVLFPLLAWQHVLIVNHNKTERSRKKTNEKWSTCVSYFDVSLSLFPFQRTSWCQFYVFSLRSAAQSSAVHDRWQFALYNSIAPNWFDAIRIHHFHWIRLATTRPVVLMGDKRLHGIISNFPSIKVSAKTRPIIVCKLQWLPFISDTNKLPHAPSAFSTIWNSIKYAANNATCSNAYLYRFAQWIVRAIVLSRILSDKRKFYYIMKCIFIHLLRHWFLNMLAHIFAKTKQCRMVVAFYAGSIMNSDRENASIDKQIILKWKPYKVDNHFGEETTCKRFHCWK